MNYLSNQRVITLFAHLFDQSACCYSFAHLFNQSAGYYSFFLHLFMVTSKQRNTGLIAHSSMELKYRY